MELIQTTLKYASFLLLHTSNVMLSWTNRGKNLKNLLLEKPESC